MNPTFLIAIGAALVLLLVVRFVSRAGSGSRGEVEQLIAAGAPVIDVRTPEEFNAGHYDGARNIPLDDLGRRLTEIGEPDAPVVLYCRTGSRSGVAASTLRRAGFTRVVNGGGLSQMPPRP